MSFKFDQGWLPALDKYPEPHVFDIFAKFSLYLLYVCSHPKGGYQDLTITFQGYFTFFIPFLFFSFPYFYLELCRDI